MENLIKELNSLFGQFSEEVFKNVFGHNKAAGVRARKYSLDIEKMLKAYRAKSLEYDKINK